MAYPDYDPLLADLDDLQHIDLPYPSEFDQIAFDPSLDLDLNLDFITPTEADLPAFDDFQSWLPRFSKPPTPCDRCASTGLDCFFTNGDETGCSSCKSLYRACTFRANKPKAGWLDTLHPVSEDVAQDTPNQIGRRPLFSQGASLEAILDEHRTTSRFPRQTTLLLKRWIDEHAAHPYPTEAERVALKEQTGLSLGQISNWLANARRRGKVRRTTSSSSAQPISISPKKDQADMTPYERWKHSPPEKDAPIDLIRQAAAAAVTAYSTEEPGVSSKTPSLGRTHWSSADTHRLSSASSVDIVSTESGSTHSHGSRRSRGSLTSTGRRRRRAPPKLKRKTEGREKIFQCTFCTDKFHIKYDWVRHEKSLHLSVEKWICCPIGPVLTSDVDGTTTCVFCGQLNPDRAHIDTHAHYECEEKGIPARTFYRKDHLRQHIRLVHKCDWTPVMEQWKLAPQVINSRCGLCPETNPTTFTNWQERADHIAAHYRDGIHIRQWKGDHGFDPEIQAQVVDSMPPWLIDRESRTPFPYSASGKPRCQHAAGQLDAPIKGRSINCWQVATQALGLYVKQCLATGIVPTDEMLQRQARLDLHGTDDPWDTTPADDPEWLRLFKQSHGLADPVQHDEMFTFDEDQDLLQLLEAM